MILKLDKKDLKDLDNISVTAYRIISIFNMLLEKPWGDKDIADWLQGNVPGARSLSQDTICIYINTLRAIGCNIQRPSKNNEFKYVLKSHPFNLELNEDEISTLVGLRKYISTLDDWKLMINVDKLYNSIIDNLEPEQKKKLSQSLKACLRDIEVNYHTQLINLLEKYCDKKRTLLVEYTSPESGEKAIEMTVDKLSYENGAFYLWGYNTLLDETQYIRVDRIKEIKAVNIKNKRYIPKIYCIRYKLTGVKMLTYIPEEGEEVIDKNENEIFIEAKVQNKFKLIQKILSYGSSCTIISPDSFKKEILSKLKAMLNNYKRVDIKSESE